jgi:hypothetical protein
MSSLIIVHKSSWTCNKQPEEKIDWKHGWLHTENNNKKEQKNHDIFTCQKDYRLSNYPQ